MYIGVRRILALDVNWGQKKKSECDLAVSSCLVGFVRYRTFGVDW